MVFRCGTDRGRVRHNVHDWRTVYRVGKHQRPYTVIGFSFISFRKNLDFPGIEKMFCRDPTVHTIFNNWPLAIWIIGGSAMIIPVVYVIVGMMSYAKYVQLQRMKMEPFDVGEIF